MAFGMQWHQLDHMQAICTSHLGRMGRRTGGQTDEQTDCLHCLLLVLMTVSNKVWLARTTDRHIHTQADTQTDRQRYTHRQTDIHTETDRETDIYTQTDRHTDRDIHRQTYTQRYRHIHTQTDSSHCHVLVMMKVSC